MKISKNYTSDFSKKFDTISLRDIINISKHKQSSKVENKTNISHYNHSSKKNSVEYLSFINKISEMPEIKPSRYVWHVASKKNRKSILNCGLLANSSPFKHVFANDHIIINRFFPYVVHCEYLENYEDFWRIDTHACSLQWRIDPNMAEETLKLGHKHDYICTNSNIPHTALKLFNAKQIYKAIAGLPREEFVIPAHYISHFIKEDTTVFELLKPFYSRNT